MYEGEVHYRFDSDGTCVSKGSVGTQSISSACTYSVTGDASNPTPNNSWIVLMSGPHVASSMEIIAIDADAFTTRDGDQRTDYGRVAPVEMRVCSGTAVACESLDVTTCETTGGCETKQGCAGPSGSGCDAYGPYGCLEHDECTVIDTCGTSLYEGCELSPDDCIARPGCSLSE